MSETTFDISVFDPFWQFPLPNVVLYATHQENKRLFGFVLRTSGGRADSRQTSICYIFESNNEGEKVLVMVIFVSIFIRFLQIISNLICIQICDSVGLAKQIAFHAELVRTSLGDSILVNGREKAYLACVIEYILQDAYRCSNAVVENLKGFLLQNLNPR